MAVTLKERKKAAEEEMDRIRAEEEKEIAQKVRDHNFERFMGRCTDWIIGKAHAQFDLQDNGWHLPKGEGLSPVVLPTAVSIHGNCGHYYSVKAQITSATNTYFHNVIPDNYQRWFTKRILDITKELMEKVLSTPECVVELMGLQGSSHFKAGRYFNEEDVPKVEAEIEKAQDEILSKFPVDQLKSLKHLSHGGSILARHLRDRTK